MSNMNGRKRKKVYSYLKNTFGAFCRGCQALESERELVIDHKDNNNSNNHPSNWQFLCRSCNYIKNPRLTERPLDVCGGGCDSLDRETEITINREKEPKFREYVELRVTEEKQVPQQDLINGGAEYCGCSIKTTARWLAKMTSSQGELQKKKVGNVTMIIIKEKSELR